MSPLFFALALVIVVLLVYMGRYSGRVQAQASRFIAAPPDAVYAAVADLAHWQPWNPWLENARQAPATVVGDTLSWDVPEVGRGSVRTLGGQPGRALRQRLTFALPFAFRGRSDWQFEPAPGGTQVTWRFKGRVAFTLRAFATTVRGATALDLRHGLAGLAATLEAQPAARSLAYSVAYVGAQAQPARRYAQCPHRGALDALAADLPPRMADLRERLAAAGVQSTGPAVVHYLKTHMKLRTVDCRIGLELPDDAVTDVALTDATLPDGITGHEQPAHTAYVVQFNGPPEELEVAWYLAMQRLRVEQLQPHPQLPPSAHYPEPLAPGQTGRVTLHLPLRG